MENEIPRSCLYSVVLLFSQLLVHYGMCFFFLSLLSVTLFIVLNPSLHYGIIQALSYWPHCRPPLCYDRQTDRHTGWHLQANKRPDWVAALRNENGLYILCYCWLSAMNSHRRCSYHHELQLFFCLRWNTECVCDWLGVWYKALMRVYLNLFNMKINSASTCRPYWIFFSLGALINWQCV